MHRLSITVIFGLITNGIDRIILVHVFLFCTFVYFEVRIRNEHTNVFSKPIFIMPIRTRDYLIDFTGCV